MKALLSNMLRALQMEAVLKMGKMSGDGLEGVKDDPNFKAHSRGVTYIQFLRTPCLPHPAHVILEGPFPGLGPGCSGLLTEAQGLGSCGVGSFSQLWDVSLSVLLSPVSIEEMDTFLSIPREKLIQSESFTAG